ncbi:MAG: quinohemoprotein amine dehydrogenase subunit beta [Azoarcus sp.]|jgi:quinohemoprotein amine dehydrogenase beta subunit|nr:quinohemoprotein amine dehydrogenase subunit beta [Azoarcus sp.]
MKPRTATLLCAALLAAAPVHAEHASPAELANNTAAPLVAGREYMVLANHPNNLSVIDLADNTVLKTCALPDAYGPGLLQISPDHRQAWLLNNRFGSIYGVELDSCNVIFSANMSLAADERTKSVLSLAISPDGKEIYTVQNPSRIYVDRYEVQQPRLAVYDTASGLDAKPVRTFPMPRQLSVMQTGADGTLYVAGPDVYKVDVKTGKYEVAMPILNWNRPGYGAPDVLNAWPVQTITREFAFLYTAPKFKDDKQDIASADFVWGIMSIDLRTGAVSVADFAPLTEVYFTGIRSPKNPNHLFTVLNVLRKYDIKEQKLLASADVGHAYYQASVNHDGSRVYLSGTLHDIAVFDAETLEKITTIPLPGGDQATNTAQVFIR